MLLSLSFRQRATIPVYTGCVFIFVFVNASRLKIIIIVRATELGLVYPRTVCPNRPYVWTTLVYDTRGTGERCDDAVVTR